jgi:hypothetical protein
VVLACVECLSAEAMGTPEKLLHRLLKSSPVALDAYGQRFSSEVNRVDLVIQYGLPDRRIALVEPERASHAIFTRKGRLRAHIGHAVQQVEDWMRWWREHPSEVPEPFDASIPIEGLVVVGRSRDLSDDDQRRLLHINSGQRVKIVTYDDLLERLEQLIALTFHTVD